MVLGNHKLCKHFISLSNFVWWSQCAPNYYFMKFAFSIFDISFWVRTVSQHFYNIRLWCNISELGVSLICPHMFVSVIMIESYFSQYFVEKRV